MQYLPLSWRVAPTRSPATLAFLLRDLLSHSLM